MHKRWGDIFPAPTPTCAPITGSIAIHSCNSFSQCLFSVITTRCAVYSYYPISFTLSLLLLCFLISLSYLPPIVALILLFHVLTYMLFRVLIHIHFRVEVNNYLFIRELKWAPTWEPRPRFYWRLLNEHRSEHPLRTSSKSPQQPSRWSSGKQTTSFLFIFSSISLTSRRPRISYYPSALYPQRLLATSCREHRCCCSVDPLQEVPGKDTDWVIVQNLFTWNCFSLADNRIGWGGGWRSSPGGESFKGGWMGVWVLRRVQGRCVRRLRSSQSRWKGRWVVWSGFRPKDCMKLLEEKLLEGISALFL